MFHMQERQLALSSLFKKKQSIMQLGGFLVFQQKHMLWYSLESP